MGSEKKVKKKCCQKYETKGKHCKSCPELQQCIMPFDGDEKELKRKKKEEKRREKELKKMEKKNLKKDERVKRNSKDPSYGRKNS